MQRRHSVCNVNIGRITTKSTRLAISCWPQSTLAEHQTKSLIWIRCKSKENSPNSSPREFIRSMWKRQKRGFEFLEKSSASIARLNIQTSDDGFEVSAPQSSTSRPDRISSYGSHEYQDQNRLSVMSLSTAKPCSNALSRSKDYSRYWISGLPTPYSCFSCLHVRYLAGFDPPMEATLALWLMDVTCYCPFDSPWRNWTSSTRLREWKKPSSQTEGLDTRCLDSWWLDA